MCGVSPERRIRWALAAAAVLAVIACPAAATEDPLGSARRLYNIGDYDGAIVAAQEVRAPALVDAARLVTGRARLERFRRSADSAELAAARETLAAIDPSALVARERAELTIGLGELLFLEGMPGAAAELFEGLLESPSAAQAAGGRDRLLEWWAAALDREAQARRGYARTALFDRLLDRMARELRADPTSAVAAYWLAAAARGAGDPDRAWDAALAGWLRLRLAGARAAPIAKDLDVLVRDAIVPERARRGADTPREASQTEAAMLAQWTQLKSRWPLRTRR
jgi:hypothetical protein